MAHTHALAGGRPSGDDPSKEAGVDVVTAAHVGHEGGRSSFWRHFAEMIVAMSIGMVVGLAVFLTAIGMTFDEALVRRPTAILIVVAVSMTVPMIAWMRHRGHGWRSCSEMAAAMLVPVIPFLCLVWFDVTASAQCGGYCALSVAAMLALMLYRRREYGMQL